MACKLDYWRADNMWAALGRPDGNLGMESITLQPGQTKVFVTDWKYEKQRNDGSNYYGSHLRRMKNSGDQGIDLILKGAGTPGTLSGAILGAGGRVRLQPGQEASVKADLAEVSCPKL